MRTATNYSLNGAKNCKAGAKSSIIEAYMIAIAITSADLCNAQEYVQVMEALGAEVRVLTPSTDGSTEDLMLGVGGLLLSGGPDVDPSLYGATPDPDAGLDVCRPLDDLELRILDYSLARDMPWRAQP